MTSSSFFNFSFPTASSICHTYFENETCDNIQVQFSHFIGKVKQIDFNTFFNFAFPVTVAAFSVYKSFPLLFGAMRGYDSPKMRAEFKNIATGGLNKKNQPIGLLERASYLKSYAFGSISIKNRLYLTAKALSWLALGALAMAPLFKKNVNTNSVHIPATIVDPNQLQATINGKEKQFALGQLSALPQLTPHLNQEHIDPQLQRMLTKGLGPETGPSLFEKVSGYFGYGNQTVPLFSEIDGRTIVNAAVLEEQCNATLTQLDSLITPAAKEKLASSLSSLCNGTIGYMPSGEETCKSFADWITPAANTTTLGLAKAQVQVACAVLGERARNDEMLAQLSPFLKSTQAFLNAKSQQITGSNGTSSTYDLAKGANFFNDNIRLEDLCSSKSSTPQKCRDMARAMFNISSETAIDPQSIKRAYKAFALRAHPDRCPADVKEICQPIFDAGTKLKDIIVGNGISFSAGDNTTTSSESYTLPELAQRALNWYWTPVNQ